MRALFAALVPALMLAGTATAQVPEYRSSANLELVAHLPGAGGTDIEFFTRELRTYKDASGNVIEIPEEEPPVTRHFAVQGNQQSGPRIIDITSPEAPFVVATMPQCRPSQGDPQIVPGGRYFTLAKQSGTCTLANGTSAGHGSIIVDINDVYAPRPIAVASAPRGAHNNTVSPDGKFIYISESGDSPGRIPIYDITDPTSPKKVMDWDPGDGGNSPHDVRFSEDGTRAYGAGINRMRIINTTNPAAPTLISSIQVPGSQIGHDTLITPDKSFLFFGEETQGGGTAPCPGGGVYVYDVRGAKEQNPELIGYSLIGNGPVTGRRYDEAFAGDIGGCTSHVMDMNPDKKSFTIGWYVSGFATFDFSSLYNADGTPKAMPKGAYFGPVGAGDGLKETGWMVPDGANTWSAKQYHAVPGYIFADDLELGFYVAKIKP